MHKKHLGEEKGVRNPPNYKSELSDHLCRSINPSLVIEGKLLRARLRNNNTCSRYGQTLKNMDKIKSLNH